MITTNQLACLQVDSSSDGRSHRVGCPRASFIGVRHELVMMMVLGTSVAILDPFSRPQSDSVSDVPCLQEPRVTRILVLDRGQVVQVSEGLQQRTRKMGR